MNRSAMLVIDVQKGLDDPALGKRSNPNAEENIARLLAAWREAGRPVIHVQHRSIEPNSPLRPELPGYAIKREAQPLPGEQHFTKTVNSAFIGTGLTEYLHANKISSLVIVGLTTDHCVSASTRMAGDLGFKVTLVSDATAAHEKTGQDGTHYEADEIHRVNLVSLDGEFCILRTTDEVLREAAS